MLAGDRQVTALWCFNDRMAMGAYRAAAEAGRRVGDDLSIIGFDNLEPIAESLAPALTTMALPYYEIGETAADVALGTAGATEPDAPPRRIRIPCPMVRRFSATRVAVRHAVPP